MDNIEELRLIKGVTPGMFDGTGQEEATTFPQHKLGFGHAVGQEAKYDFHLVDVFTPFSSGKINLLTADENVLSAIFGKDSSIVQNILTARDVATIPPARSVGELLAGANPQALAQMSRYLDIRGDTYEVHATATIGDLSHEYTAILFRIRGGSTVLVVSFYRTK